MGLANEEASGESRTRLRYSYSRILPKERKSPKDVLAGCVRRLNDWLQLAKGDEMNGMRTILAVLMVALPLGMGAMAVAQTAAEGSGRIIVNGEGSVNIAPDTATIMLGVTTSGETAAAALAENSAQVAVVLTKLTEAGIGGGDVQTSGLSLNPQYYYDPTGADQTPDITGYIANNSVTVRVRELSKLGSVLDSVVQGGANTVNGLTFGLLDQQPALDEARARAVADGKRKAELLAQAAGVALGPIRSITETSGYASPAPMFRMDASASGSAVPVAEGELGVTAMVTLEFGFGD